MSIIVVAAPAYRMGTTFVQRLLNCTNKCMIYGEHNLIIQAMLRQLDEINSCGTRSKLQWHEFQKDKNSWTANLQADYQLWATKLRTLLLDMFVPAGFIGGFKKITLTKNDVKTLLTLLPEIKIIYCSRNLRNAKNSYMNMYGFLSEKEYKQYVEMSLSPYDIKEFSDCIIPFEFEQISEDYCCKLLEKLNISYDPSMVKTVVDTKIRERNNYLNPKTGLITNPV